MAILSVGLNNPMVNARNLLLNHTCMYLYVYTVTVTGGDFTVGSVAVVTCSSDDGVVDRIELISEAGQLMANKTSVQMLALPLDPVTDSLHLSEFICFVTRYVDNFHPNIDHHCHRYSSTYTYTHACIL